jgi:hypothetical protein
VAAGLALSFGGMAVADERPAVAATTINNQVLANNVASTLEKSGNLRGYSIDVTCMNGSVELTGKVADQTQHDAIINTAMAVPGVRSVIDNMTPNNSLPIRPAQAVQIDGPAPAPGMLPAPGGAPIIDPIPLGQPGGSSPYDMSPPKLPPYSWPTYAPYNNLSRVAYPNNYPYNSFPFIGPFYPFPKVPLGWRSVTLEWQDGHWWMGRNASKYDYWRVRYW